MKCLTVFTTIFLTHTVNAYYIEKNLLTFTSNESTYLRNTRDTSDDIVLQQVSSDTSLLLLSKAAHRRANKELKMSSQEEFFKLSFEQISLKSALTQLQVLNRLVYVAYDLLVSAFKSNKHIDLFESEDELNNIDNEKLIDVNKLEHYLQHLRKINSNTHPSKKNSINGDDDEVEEIVVEDENEKNGNMATIALLHIEIVLEVFENAKFHQKLVKVVDSTGNDVSASSVSDDEVYSEKNAIQTQFLEIVDVVLHLLSFATNIEKGFYSKNNKESNSKNIANSEHSVEDDLIIHLDANPLKISFKKIG